MGKKEKIMSEQIRFCENCGNGVNPGDRFCIRCGHALIPGVRSASVQPSPATGAASTAPSGMGDTAMGPSVSGATTTGASSAAPSDAIASETWALPVQEQIMEKITTGGPSPAAPRVSPTLRPGQLFSPVQGAVKKLRSEQIAEQASVPYNPSRTGFVFPQAKFRKPNPTEAAKD